MIEKPAQLEQEASGFNMNPALVLGRRWPFLVLGLLIGIAIGAFHFLSSPNVYQSSAQLLVIKKRTDVVQGADVRVGVLEDYVQTQLTVVASQKIRVAAARLVPVNRLNRPLPVGSPPEAYAGIIAQGLVAQRDKNSTPGQVGSGVMLLSFRGSDPEDTKLYLESVIQAYENELSGIYEQTTQDRLAVLQKAIDSSRQRRADSEQQRQAKQDEIRRITTEELNSIRNRVTLSRNQLDLLKLEQLDMADQLELIAKAGQNRKDRLMVFAQLTSGNRTGPAVDPLDADLPLRQLQAKKRELEQELGAQHPTIKQINAQIQFYQDEIRRQNPETTGAVDFDELTGMQKRLIQRKKTIDRQIEQIETRLSEDETKVLEGGRIQDRVDSLKQLIDQEEREERRLFSEKQSLEATQGSGGYSTNQLTPPGNGGQVGPLLYQSALLGLVAGLMIGTGIMVLVELADKSFHSPAEIRQRLGVPVLGHVPQIRPGQAAEPNTPTGLDPTLIAALLPKSSEAEAYRGLRTQLFFSMHGKSGVTLQVTSPNPGDGKSTLAANLAISIAQSGKRVVLIDCDFRKPRVHKLFKIDSAEVGLASLVASGGPIAKALRASPVEGLMILPCGPKPTNPAELLTSNRFSELLADLRNSYDYVIVDTPPLLAVTDPAIVAPRVDGVIMTFRMTRAARPNAERARDQIIGVGGNLLGVVVNAWSGSRRAYEGYNYGSGGYSYAAYEYADDYSEK